LTSIKKACILFFDSQRFTEGYEGIMAKAKTGSVGQISESAEAPTIRERLELVLFVVVEVLCLLLFIDFLFVGFYVK